MTQTQDARVEQRHYWAADNYLEHFGLNALNRDHMALAFARFEAHLRSTSPAGEVGEMIAWFTGYVEGLPREWAEDANEGRADPDVTPEDFADSETLRKLRNVLKRLAASDTEAMELLREARAEIEWWVKEHGCCDGHQDELTARIDAALAKGGAA